MKTPSFSRFYEKWTIRSFTYFVIIAATLFLGAGIYMLVNLSNTKLYFHNLKELTMATNKLGYLVNSIDRTITTQDAYIFAEIDQKTFARNIDAEVKISTQTIGEIKSLANYNVYKSNVDKLDLLVTRYFESLKKIVETNRKPDINTVKDAIKTMTSIHGISEELNEMTSADIQSLMSNLQGLNYRVSFYLLIGLLAGVIPLLFTITLRVMEGKASKNIKYSFATTQGRLKAALESMTDAVFISDVFGNFVEFNEAFVKFYKFKNKSDIVKNLDEYVKLINVYSPNGELITRKDLAISRALQGETEKNAEVMLERTDTGERWAGSYSYGPIKDTNGEIIGSVVVGRDISEKKRIEEAIENQLKRLDSLHDIDVSIIESTDIDIPMKIILEQVVRQLQVDAADVRLNNPSGQTFSLGFSTKSGEIKCLETCKEIAHNVIVDQNDLCLVYPMDGVYSAQAKDLHALFGFSEYCAIPLSAKGDSLGVLEVYIKDNPKKDDNWFDFLIALAGQASIAINNYNLFHNLKRMNQELINTYDATIEGWSRALDMRDNETEGHSLRVAEMTYRLAIALKVPEEDLVNIRRGALLHDIGKLGIPDRILLKPSKLTEEEFEMMKKHTQYGFDLLSPIRYLLPAIPIPYCHHERWDGTGYPQGLKGEQIPLSARIFAIVDVWDALANDRPYRKKWPHEKIVAYLRSLSGIQFDPKVVDAFMELFGDKTIEVNQLSNEAEKFG